MSEVRVSCPPDLNKDTGESLLNEVRHQRMEQDDTLILDFKRTDTMDALGGAWLVKVADSVRSRGAELKWEGQSGSVDKLIRLFEPGLLVERPKRPHREIWIEHLGGVVIAAGGELREFKELFVDIVYWTFVGPLEGRKFRWAAFFDEMHEMGVRAVPIIALVNFLLGLIIAMLSAAQTKSLGLNILVADLMVIGFARELAALMTAVMVSARTGAAIAAELATMKVQEEIDALRGMGFNVAQFLLAPKVLALVISMPCLVTLGFVCGVLGGSVWGVYVLDITWREWMKETINAVEFNDFFQGYSKAMVFAVVIVLVGIHNGLRVTGGSRGVGLMTTRAVVMDVFFIVFVDMIFAAIFYYVL